jgi:hypothetical protein
MDSPNVFYPILKEGTIEYRWTYPVNSNNFTINDANLVVNGNIVATLYSNETRSVINSTAGETYAANVYYNYLDAQSQAAQTDPVNFVTVVAGILPGPTSNVTVSASNSSVSVSWNPASENGGSPIRWQVIKIRSSTSNAILQKIPLYPWDSNTVFTANLSNGEYSLSVQAVNDAGYSSKTTTSPLYVLPAPYVNFSAFSQFITSNTDTYWADTGSNGYNAIVTGTASKNVQSNGVVFDGSTYFEFPSIGDLAGIFTIAAWYKDYGTNSYVGQAPCIVTNILDTPSLTVEFSLGTGINGLGGFRTGVFNAGLGSGWQYTPDPINIESNVWTHIAATLDGTTMILYSNGSIVSSNAYTNYASFNSLANLIGKRWDNAEFLSGEIGNLKIYQVALSSNEITALYNTESNLFTV